MCQTESLHIRGPLRLMSHRPVTGGFSTAGGQPFVIAEYPDGLSMEVCRAEDGMLEADIYRAASARRRRIGLHGWAALLSPQGWVGLSLCPAEPAWWGWDLGTSECLPKQDRPAVVHAAYGLGQDERDRIYTLRRWSLEPGFYCTRYRVREGEPWIDPISLLAAKVAPSFEDGSDLVKIVRDEIETNEYAQRATLAELLSEALQEAEGPLWVDASGLPLAEHEASSWLAKVFKPIRNRAVIVSAPGWRHPGIAERLWEYSRREGDRK